ncbi:MAG: phosphatase PAP2 family protein [Dehalococcoidia bacterium]
MAVRALFVAWLALLGAAIALSVLAAQHDTLPGDTSIMSWAQERAFPGQTLSDIVRAITTTEVVLATGGAMAIGLWLLGHRWEAVLLAAGLVALPLLQAGVKELVDRPRPAGPLAELRASFSSESFPAGHVMSPTYLYGTLLYLSIRSELPRALRLTAGAWSALVIVLCGPPNVWLGVHWPSDVLGGWAWGLLLAGPVALVLEARYRRR